MRILRRPNEVVATKADDPNEGVYPFDRYGGFVYVIARPRKRMYKIGKSWRPWERLRSLQASMKIGDLQIVHTIFTNDSARLEKYLHARFSEVSVGGEWFELTDAMLTEIQSAVTVMYPNVEVVDRKAWLPARGPELNQFRKQPYPVCGWVSPSGA